MSHRPTRVLALAAAVLAAVPACAAASTKDLPVSGAGASGTVRTLVDVQGDGVTVEVPSTTVQLPAGISYRLRTCAEVHLDGQPPASRCANRAVDLTGQTGVVEAETPPEGFGFRLPDGAWGWAAGRSEVQRWRPEGWRPVASSWPAGSVRDAALPVARPADEDRARAWIAASGLQGVPVAGGEVGGTNTGWPDSLCAAAPTPRTQPVPPGLVANPLGPGPAPSEGGEPAGPAKGVALVLHGGSWTLVGEGIMDELRPETAQWRAAGWRTIAASYRACGASATDVLWFVDRIKAAYPDLPLCVSGASAGGQLALLAASARPASVDCVVAHGAPTDLAAIGAQRAAGQDVPGQEAGPRWVANIAASVFGADNLAHFSPDPSRIRARVLLALSALDHLIPRQQATGFRDAMRRTDPAADVAVQVVPVGDRPYVHGGASDAGLIDLGGKVAALMERTVAGFRSPSPEQPQEPGGEPPAGGQPLPEPPVLTPVPPAPTADRGEPPAALPPSPPAAPALTLGQQATVPTRGARLDLTGASAVLGVRRTARGVVVRLRTKRAGTAQLRLRSGRRVLAVAKRKLRARVATQVTVRLGRAARGVRTARLEVRFPGGLRVERRVRLRR